MKSVLAIIVRAACVCVFCESCFLPPILYPLNHIIFSLTLNDSAGVCLPPCPSVCLSVCLIHVFCFNPFTRAAGPIGIFRKTFITQGRRQSKTLLTIDERRSKIDRNSVFDWHFSPVRRQMAIQNSVSNYF